MSPEKIQAIIERMPSLPDSANVPIEVAAEHDGVSSRTVRRHYQTVDLAPNRKGVNLGWLRHRHNNQQQPA